MTALEFVRDSATPETFDGWWQVWRGTTCVGYVRKTEDPIDSHKPWGWKLKPMAGYPRGVVCAGGYRTRLEAGVAVDGRFATALARFTERQRK